MTIVDGIAKGHFLRAGPDPIGSARRMEIGEKWTAEAVLFFVPGEFGSAPGIDKKGISAETPQHDHHITKAFLCQLSSDEKLRILCFQPFIRKLFGRNPVLQKSLRHGRLMVRKKVIPNMVSTPAGRAFQSSVLHKCQSQSKAEEHECLRKGFKPNKKSPVDPAESEVTQ